MRNLLCNQTWFNRIKRNTEAKNRMWLAQNSRRPVNKEILSSVKQKKREPRKRVNMFCPSANEKLAQLTEKTKLFAQKCSANVTDVDSPSRHPVATFKSYIDEDVKTSSCSKIDENFDIEKFAPESPARPFQCLTVNLTNLNRLIKSRCSFVSTTSQTCFTSNTFPRKKKSSPLPTTMWYIKVSI